MKNNISKTLKQIFNNIDRWLNNQKMSRQNKLKLNRLRQTARNMQTPKGRRVKTLIAFTALAMSSQTRKEPNQKNNDI